MRKHATWMSNRHEAVINFLFYLIHFMVSLCIFNALFYVSELLVFYVFIYVICIVWIVFIDL